MPDLDALFRQRSIMFAGAPPDRTIIRGRIVEAVALHGFGGERGGSVLLTRLRARR